MPELPEVETVRRGLHRHIAGETVEFVEIRHLGILEGGGAERFEALAGSKFVSVDRRAKYLLLRLGGDGGQRTVVVHLGMTGQLTWKARDQETTDVFRRLVSGYRKSAGPHPIDTHTHMVVRCESGGTLLFRDPRRFGRILLLEGHGDGNCQRLEKLGPDAWRLDHAEMAGRLRACAGKRSVKAVLLDQTVVAGIGNIYADEACFASGIRPSRILSSLPGHRVAALARAIDEVLEKGVRNAGTSFRDFVGADGESGANQEDLKVYGRAGQPCDICDRPLRGAVVAQRTTVWCSRCQT